MRPEARRIAAEFGLGRHVKAWRRGSKVTEWALAYGFLIGLPVVTAMLALTARGQSASLPVPDYEDHAGNTVAIGKRAPELLTRAEQVLTARLNRPAN